MGLFDSPADAPFQIKTEGETITLVFQPGYPVTGQGTISWNIPTPAHGCQAADGRGAYCGMLVVLDTKPITVENRPQDGRVYTPDPSANRDVHAGDKIGDALVVGAVYDGEKRAQGEELTTSLVVSDLDPNVGYYIAGYAVDCQNRYHSEGTRAYSDKFGNQDEPDTPSTQTVLFKTAILPTDGTGLVPGKGYDFEIEIDDTFPSKTNAKTLKITVDGRDAGTYEALVGEINKSLALIDNPPQSPVPPNKDRYYWDAVNEQLFQWDGYQHIFVSGVLVEDTDPANPALGDYWYNPTAEVLQRWSVPTPGIWNAVSIIAYRQDPRNLKDCDDYWFDGTKAYKWCATTWCQEILFNTTEDPSCPRTPDCGIFWYDEVNEKLLEWDLEKQQWIEVFAVVWPDAPNNLTIGTFWFNTTTEELFRWDPSWTNVAVIVSVEEPSSPMAGMYWFNPETEELKVYNGTTLMFEDVGVLVWPADPTDVESCELWWQPGSPEQLFKWDNVHNEWDEVVEFIQSLTDPFGQPTLEVGSVWYNPGTEVLQRWDGLNWIEVTYINFPTDPTEPSQGDAWLNTETGEWSIWNTPITGDWNAIDPIDSENDPFLVPQGTLWFNTSTNVLSERIGLAWVAVSFSTIPFTPVKGEMWYDTTNNVLMEWNGTTWIETTPIVVAEITDGGAIKFTTSFKGSTACVMILVPLGAESAITASELASGTANFAGTSLVSGHSFTHYGIHQGTPVSETTVSVGDFLWDHLTPEAGIQKQIYGEDGLRGLPSYEQVGVGDDGTPDERRELIDSIRSQLGYPVIDVELTPYQIDTAVSKALEKLRTNSSVAYRRGFFFLDIQPSVQHYKLTNRTIGFHKIVTVMAAYRFTSAFLSTAHGAGVYGQIVLQHLYNMGTYDLTSFHLISQYVEQLEHLFATRLTYHWDEPTRVLSFYHSFVNPERVLLDTTIERPEQELLTDRWSKLWVEKWALSEARIILGEIRGKYASLPGAGGGVSLNASELLARADQDQQELLQQLDDFVVNDVEDIGMHSTFIIG